MQVGSQFNKRTYCKFRKNTDQITRCQVVVTTYAEDYKTKAKNQNVNAKYTMYAKYAKHAKSFK